ncbi:MAG: hypothetical protein R3A52_13385 [Polyangiales bacterium]
MTRTLSALTLLALLGCTRGRDTPAVDRSDGNVPELRVPWVPNGAMRIDGALDEGEWSRAGHIEGFVAPGTGHSVRGSRANAEAWVAWCDEGLLVAFRVLDGAPRSFVAAARARPAHLGALDGRRADAPARRPRRQPRLLRAPVRPRRRAGRRASTTTTA